jgi:hypothetical protein
VAIAPRGRTHLHLSHFGLFFFVTFFTQQSVSLPSFFTIKECLCVPRLSRKEQCISEGARYLGRSKVCGDCSKFTAKHLRAAEGKMSVTLGLFGPSVRSLLTRLHTSLSHFGLFDKSFCGVCLIMSSAIYLLPQSIYETSWFWNRRVMAKDPWRLALGGPGIFV